MTERADPAIRDDDPVARPDRSWSERLAAVVFDAPIGVPLTLAVVVSGLLFGIFPAPFAERFVAIAQNPLSPPDPDDFLLASPLSPLIASLAGLDTMFRYTAFSFVLLMASATVAVVSTDRWRSPTAARLVLVAWFASPVINVELTWLGMYDPWTWTCACLLVVAPRWVVGAACLVLGFNQFEQGAFILAAAIGVRWVDGRPRSSLGRADLAVWVASFATGRLLLSVYLGAAGASPSRLGYIGERGVGRYVEAAFSDLPTLLFSVYGVLWIPLVLMIRSSDQVQRWFFLLAHAILTIPVLVALDSTRVYALLTWPLVMGCVLWWSEQPSERVRRGVPLLLVSAIVVPRVVLWDSAIYVSSWGRLLDG